LTLLFRRPPWDAPVLWALDLETSELDPRRGEILSVGMVPIRSGTIRYGERYYSLVRPEAPERLSAAGIAAHHILPAELAAAPPKAAVLPEVDRRLREGVLLLHHAPLDVGFLRRVYLACRLPWPRPRVVDTLDLMLAHEHRRQRFHPHPELPATALPAARAALGLPPHEAHHALSDAVATAELFLALRARRNR
jgi:DNA polymerase III subunit epsilon